jgi:hypothetical protein
LTWEKEVTVANVISATDITVIILEDDEAKALEDLMYQHPTLNEDFPALDELVNAMISPVRAQEGALTWKDRDDSDDASHVSWQGRFDAVQEGAGMVMHPVCKQCGKFIFAVDGCKGHG